VRRPVGSYERKSPAKPGPFRRRIAWSGARPTPLGDARRIPFFMLNNILGGPGMNSRLNLAVREKYGLVYTIDSTYSPYTDTGLFGIYFGTEGKQVKRTLGLVQKELKLLREKADHQPAARGQAPADGPAGHERGKQRRHDAAAGQKHPRPGPRGAAERNLRAASSKITAAELREMANEVLTEEHLSVLQYVPEGEMSQPVFGHVGSYRPGDVLPQPAGARL
jgi:predicted Zn-dependent peptidase